jgi:hypothetical protein
MTGRNSETSPPGDADAIGTDTGSSLARWRDAASEKTIAKTTPFARGSVAQKSQGKLSLTIA